MRRKQVKVGVGLALWIGIGVGVVHLVQAKAPEFEQPYGKLKRYLAQSPRLHEVQLAGHLRVGDPVMNAEREYLGRVAAIQSGTGAPDWDDPQARATATWHLADAERYTVLLSIDPEAAAKVPGDPTFRTRRRPKDARWILKTLLPEHKKAIVQREVEAFLRQHEDQLSGFLRPIAEDVIAHGMKVMEANLNKALEKRDPEIRALVARHRDKTTNELLPVMKDELGPLFREKAEPILKEIGRELWEELSVVKLGWNAFVDRLPGTSKKRVDAFWAKFLAEKAMPILKKHEQELVDAFGEMIDTGVKNKRVRAALAKATRRLAKDPKFKQVVRGILEDALIRPFELKKLMDRLLKSPAHARRLQRLSNAFAPTMERLAHQLTVDPKSGRIDPDLAAVLRRVVFLKDVRWVELLPSPPAGS